MIQISDESPPPGSNETETEQLDAGELNNLANEVKSKNICFVVHCVKLRLIIIIVLLSFYFLFTNKYLRLN